MNYGTSYRRWVVGLAILVTSSLALWGNADEFDRIRDRERDRDRDRDYRTAQVQYQPSVPTLSESTAVLEAAVRTMYKNIEPSRDTSPNELLAYADLRALRLYAGALEVAGWSMEQAASEYQRFRSGGSYRDGRGRNDDPQAAIASERYRGYRETVRTLLYRVRQTAIAVEHQVSFCDPQVAQEWQQEVAPALRDVVASTDPIFAEEVVFQSYAPVGETVAAPRIVRTAANGIPGDAIDIIKSPTFAPHDGRGRGRGKFIEVRAFGGPIRVVALRFRSHEQAFGLSGTSTTRQVDVDQISEPGQPLFIPLNRRRWVELSELEVDWEPAERGRRAFATVELVETCPTDLNR